MEKWWLRCQGGRAMGAVVSMAVVVKLAIMMAYTNKHIKLSFTCPTHVQTCSDPH
jgi:hypothetical protein